MKKRLLSLCMACAMLPIAMCAQGTTQSSHHKLGSNIDYPINRLSPDGRYMGGWKNGVSYVYDTQMNQTLTTLGGDNLTVYLKSINNDGSIWASRIDNEGIKYGLYKDGKWTDLPKPEGFSGGWLRHVTPDQKYTVNSYTNSLSDMTLISDAFLYERKEDGTYRYRKLIKPKNDCWTESEVFHVDPMQISNDGRIVLGHMVDGLSKYIFPIIWERNAAGEYEYRIKGESFCFNLDQPSPGNPPIEEEMVTAEPGTPEYEEQLAQYYAAVEQWNALAAAFWTGKALHGYPFMDNQGTTIGTALFTGEQDKGSQPLLLSIADDSYALIEYYKTEPFMVTSSGTAFLLNRFMDGIHHNVMYTLGSNEVIPFDKWLKAEYDLTLENEYLHGFKVFVGEPAMSDDGKTLAFTLKFPNGTYKNHYYRLNKSLNLPTSMDKLLSTNPFRVYSSGKTLYTGNSTPCDIRIVNTNGQGVAKAENVVSSLDLKHLSAGIYVAAITRDKKTEFFKIVLAD
ncbi:T9SS type A sorting domain-containing protein [Porphyromonas gingivalis]|uniref:T9SS type A sorting domain-containing protein n=1 Tax=Porphyromonas gingivalis TaxID=837 RepID=UPI0024DF8D13|nr:T9SS type A sorting domain-containing protein [Porphyromonas gingivalis]WIM91812.1 T9SS type A sorting domain-containing protein [Porphyromonas gingivalis]